MPNIVPGVVWQPVDVGNRARRIKGRGLCGHVAVSSSKNLAPGPLATRPSDWHFYLPKIGAAIQYIDLDVQCWATGAGNSTMVAFESEGGLGTTAEVNAEPWTANQVEWAANILAHLHNTEGTPLQDMGNSLASSRGFGVHRYGIDPYRVAGGEVWSSSYGKACPGDAKVRQIPAIVARAQEIVNGDDMSATAEKLIAEIHAMLGAGNAVGTPTDNTIGARLTRVEGVLFAGTSATPASATVYQRLARVEDAVKALAGTSSGSKLPTEFDVPGFITQIKLAVADELDRRDRDNDPDTGRSS